jgi:hypothetical protein
MAELYQENNFENSKYIYRNIESENDMFIFELIFKKINQKNQKIRKLYTTRSGPLLTSYDNISYSDIKKIVISIVDINNPNKEIFVECSLDHNNKHTVVLNSNVYIEFFEINGLVESKYNLINI